MGRPAGWMVQWTGRSAMRSPGAEASAGGPAEVLARDRVGGHKRGCGGLGRRVDGSGMQVIPARWRHATTLQPGRVRRSLPVVRRAGLEPAPAGVRSAKWTESAPAHPLDGQILRKAPKQTQTVHESRHGIRPAIPTESQTVHSWQSPKETYAAGMATMR